MVIRYPEDNNYDIKHMSAVIVTFAFIDPFPSVNMEKPSCLGTYIGLKMLPQALS